MFREHARFVARLLYRLGVSSTELEDAVQEVFTVAAARVDTYEERGAARSWLYAMALHVSRGVRRGRARERAIVLDDRIDERSVEAADATEQQQLIVRAAAALDTLSEDHREAFVLHVIEELPLREVAEVTGSPLQTIYSRVQAARTKIRAALTLEKTRAAG